MSSVRTVIRVIARLLEQISTESEETLRDIAEGRATVRVVSKRGRERSQEHLSAADLGALKERLSGIQSREEALKALEEACPTGKQLEQLARSLDLPVQREDTVQRLRDKIVEATVGFKLRSDAIQGRFDLEEEQLRSKRPRQ